MSQHYIRAAKVVEEVRYRKKSFNSCATVFNLSKIEFAIAAETLKHVTMLEKVFQRIGCPIASINMRKGLLLVMLYELLFGSKSIEGGGAVKKFILSHKDRFLSVLDDLKEEEELNPAKPLLPENVVQAAKIFRYIRINELKITVEEGFEQCRVFCPQATKDEVIPSLIRFPPATRGLGDLKFVKDSCGIIQDKASCIPSQVLIDCWQGGNIIDACAAPGNKTSHIASSLVKRTGLNHFNVPTIYAFEKSTRRFELLKQRMANAAADKIVDVRKYDFLKTNPQDFGDVKCILLDPSCSGTGVVKAIERANDRSLTDRHDSRITQLRNFQVAALRHSMSFPHVEFIVYSTCSVNQSENEDVIGEVLKDSNWDVFIPWRLSSWQRRGNPITTLSEAQSQCLIRCLPEDGMNGFFVAALRKLTPSTSKKRQLSPEKQPSNEKSPKLE